MLGCHDFCGHYEWTFHYVRAAHGQNAVRRLWAEAIGGESQQAYLAAATRAGLRGLLEIWTQTGRDEQCDWTFTLGEEHNVLRWDMRACPSKGFLLDNDLNADEDYCDHCMGWIVPLLERAGIEVAHHEHNHRGQCWAEMRVKGTPFAPLKLPTDIRADARWTGGYVHSFEAGHRIEDDDVDTLLRCCRGREIVTDETWLARADSRRCAVVIGDDVAVAQRVAQRWRSLAEDDRPVLLHAYFPRPVAGAAAGASVIPFPRLGLPRPMPILPALIRAGVYQHIADSPHPSPQELVKLLQRALQSREDLQNDQRSGAK